MIVLKTLFCTNSDNNSVKVCYWSQVDFHKTHCIEQKCQQNSNYISAVDLVYLKYQLTDIFQYAHTDMSDTG